MNNSKPPEIEDIFIRGAGFINPKLKDLMTSIEAVPDSFCAVGRLSSNQILYVSSCVETILGYPQEHFLTRGTKAFYDITSVEYLPRIMETTSLFLKQCKEPGYDFKATNTFRFEAAFASSSGKIIPIVQCGVFLDYTNNERILEFFIASNFTYQKKNKAEIKETEMQLTKLLNALKENYIELYSERFIISRQSNPTLVKNYFPLAQNVSITTREGEVLKLLGQGYSTKEISSLLNISFNTTESYRKSLLNKFDAKNSAELVKKASKVYWLE